MVHAVRDLRAQLVGNSGTDGGETAVENGYYRCSLIRLLQRRTVPRALSSE